MTIIAVEAVTHATIFFHLDWMSDPGLADELTHLIVSYLSPTMPKAPSMGMPFAGGQTT
jgi:hypothetical protein